MIDFKAETSILRPSLIIDGKEVAAAGGATFEAVSPANNETIGIVPRAGIADAVAAIEAAHRAFESGPWSRFTPLERSRALHRMATVLRERIDEISTLETMNSGKIIVESRGDVVASANCFEYYGNLAGQIWGDQIPMNGPLLDYTVREPYGVCSQIIPWNFPLLMAAWKVAPALAAGNTVVLKPASATPLTALILGQIALEAGIPGGVLNVISGSGKELGETLTTHPLVEKVAFTGETATGREIMRAAAGSIKKVTLELGGKSPNIVFPDADLEEAVNGSLFAIFTNAGQRCTARTRLFLHKEIYDEFLSTYVEKVSKIRVGDPLDWDTQMGPVISKQQQSKVLEYCEYAVEDGAELLHGGRRVAAEEFASGNFVEPTVFGKVSADMRLAQNEVFGPVLAVIPFESEDEVVAAANSTIFGLAATIWTNDIKRAHTMRISPPTGYKWLRRYQQAGAAGLQDRSRRPHHSPGRTSAEQEALVVGVREAYPAWGGRKVRAWLEKREYVDVPRPSTITEILRRHGHLSAGLTPPPQRWRRFERAAPNQLWQMDFKGHVPLGQGAGRLHPLTILDDHSRFAIGLEACTNERASTVQQLLTACFRRYGLPDQMLMDNGSPWGASPFHPFSYTTLTVWLLRLGIRLSHGRAAHPQTQGKDERFHRTLKAELLQGPPFASLRQAQAAFDVWRDVYNLERPHEACGLEPPIGRYRPSERAYPERLPAIAYAPDDQPRRVGQDGAISFHRRDYAVGLGFRGQTVAVRPTATDGMFDVYFMRQQLRRIDLRAASPAVRAGR